MRNPPIIPFAEYVRRRAEAGNISPAYLRSHSSTGEPSCDQETPKLEEALSQNNPPVQKQPA